MKAYGEDGDLERVIHQGQWVAGDDPLVKVHPYQFELPKALG